MPRRKAAFETNQGNGGIVALIFWCLFFLPVCILSVLHFKKATTLDDKQTNLLPHKRLIEISNRISGCLYFPSVI